MKNSNYKIESKSDFLTGTYLTVSIAESDLDQNALHTIQTDCPDFILPFNYICTNGQVELTYKVGSLCKLQYFYGDITHEEYITIWRSLLSPLLECGDWYMNPCSFLLSTDYLYYDKNKKTVVYIYIPSKKGCSGYDAFNEMAIVIAKNITVSDPVLENKVLRSIINDFNPGEFLKMLIEHMSNNQSFEHTAEHEAAQVADVLKEIDELEFSDYSGNVQTEENINAVQPVEIKQKEPVGFRVFSGKSKKKQEGKHNGYKNSLPVCLPVTETQKTPHVSDITQETKALMSGPGLRCIGRAHLPQVIEVAIEEGSIFTIGRFDASVGKQQSSFEFDKKTKAVSRRHAVIEREGLAYKIIDLSSSAGTFVNDKKLPPNTPHELITGSRISFGNLGADYVWE